MNKILNKVKELFTEYKFSKNETIIMYLLVSFIITIICFAIQPDTDVRYILGFKSTNYVVLILNFIPIFLLISFLGNLLNNIFLSSSINSVLLFSASIVNRYKIIYRDEPFMPLDLTIFTEAFDAVTNMDYSINIFLFLILLFLCLIQFIASFKYKPFEYSKKVKIYSMIFLLILGIGLNSTIYSRATIYSWLPNAVTEFKATDNFNSKGFVYSFIYTFNTEKTSKPENYSPEIAEQLLNSYSDSSNTFGSSMYNTQLAKSSVSEINDSRPNIIFVLSESFMDVSKIDNLKFTDENDVLKNYKEVKDDSIFSGEVIVPGFGGATSSTEFEVLTGISSTLLNNGGKNPLDLIKTNIVSVPSVLKNEGYGTVAIHPGSSWFYNRASAYKNLSFDKMLFIDSFDTVNDLKGIYISESATMKKLINEIDYNMNNDNRPYFYNLVTIQNHGPYNEGRYHDASYEFETTVPISESSEVILTNYLYGLKDVDQGIKTITDYLNSLDNPFILVYYSDHLPYLGPDFQVYNELEFNILPNETIESQNYSKTTNYIIWCNEAAKKDLNREYLNSLDKNMKISSNFLPALTLNLFNMNNIHPYYLYLSDLFSKYTVTSTSVYDKNSKIIYPVPQEQQQEITNYGILGYYLCKNEFITKK